VFVGAFVDVSIRVGIGSRDGNPVIALEPAAQIGHLAALAAEWLPPRLDGSLAAVHAQRLRGHLDILQGKPESSIHQGIRSPDHP
jgi:hypothetical protein